MKKTARRLSKKRILRKRKIFLTFLSETGFPNPERIGERCPGFEYPEWLIMFIAVPAVKLKLRSYVKIHKMSEKYRNVICDGHDMKPVSERRLRDRLKKICHHDVETAASVFQIFPELNRRKSDKC